MAFVEALADFAADLYLTGRMPPELVAEEPVPKAKTARRKINPG